MDDLLGAGGRSQSTLFCVLARVRFQETAPVFGLGAASHVRPPTVPGGGCKKQSFLGARFVYAFWCPNLGLEKHPDWGALAVSGIRYMHGSVVCFILLLRSFLVRIWGSKIEPIFGFQFLAPAFISS